MRGQEARDQAERKAVMATLAQASGDDIARLWGEAGLTSEAELLRGPETGLVTVRGRIGGGGAPFNLGEVTVTRATVRLASGSVGHAQALGTDREKARLCAIFDALWQEEATKGFVEDRLLSPISSRIAAEAGLKAEETAATRVDFFTMVRGDN